MILDDIICSSPVVQTYIITLSGGTLARMYACNPGGYFIEDVSWITGDVGKLRKISQEDGDRIARFDSQPQG